MQPVGRDLYVDKYLSGLSIAYMNEPGSYIADQAFPIVPTNVQSGKIAVYTKDYWFTDEVKERAPLTMSEGTGYEVTYDTYFCREYALHKLIDDDDVLNADLPFQPYVDATNFLIEKARINREIRFASTYFGTGIWTTNLTGIATGAPTTNQFLCWDVSGATPISDILGAKVEAQLLIGRKPNVMIVSDKVHNCLLDNSDIKSRFVYTNSTGVITRSMLASVFDVEKYIVASAIKNTSNEGATASLAYILNQYGVLLLYIPSRPSLRTPSAGYTIRWSRPQFNGQGGPRFASTVRRFEKPEIGGKKLEISFYEQMKLISADCGVFMNNVIQDGRDAFDS